MMPKKRRKDICVVNFSENYEGFDCKTDASIVSVNGQSVNESHDLAKISVFPIDFIEQMAEKYYMNKKIFGDMASNILVYRDKLTGAPKIIMNTDIMVPFEQDEELNYAFGRLSRAARSDAFRQIDIRQKIFQDYYKDNQTK